MKKHLPIIIIAVLVVIVAGLGFYSHQKSKIKYNTSYVNGNTAGNLYNAGLFCEKNGTVYLPIRMTITGCIPWIQTAII